MYAATCSLAVLGFILETSNNFVATVCRPIGSSTLENARHSKVK